MTHAYPKLHNAMWPGLVGKGHDPGQEPPLSLERMLDLTAAASVNGQKFEELEGSPPDNGQQIGVFAASPPTGVAAFGFDNLTVTKP